MVDEADEADEADEVDEADEADRLVQWAPRKRVSPDKAKISIIFFFVIDLREWSNNK